MNTDQPLWTPSAASIDAANMTHFIAQVNRKHQLAITDYDALYRWSLDETEHFWSELWDFCGIIGDKGEHILVGGDQIERAQLHVIEGAGHMVMIERPYEVAGLLTGFLDQIPY